MEGKPLHVQLSEEGPLGSTSSHSCKLCGASFPSEFGLLLHFNEEHVLPQERKLGEGGVVSEREFDSDGTETTESEDEFPDPDAHMDFVTDCERRILQASVSSFISESKVIKEEPELLEWDETETGDTSGDVHVLGVHPDTGPSSPCQASNEGGGMSHKAKDLQQTEHRFECIFCGKKYPKKFRLHIHIRSHTLEQPYFCKLCDRCFASNVYLQKHEELVHRKKRPFSCTTCGRNFSLKPQLAEHMRTHTPYNNLFNCKHCEKQFTRKRNLILHIKIHHPEVKPYECDYCEDRFLRRDQLVIHISATHPRENSFRCVYCSMCFSEEDSKDEHMKSHERTYECDQCQKKFRRPYHLQLHMTSMHNPVNPFSCQLCDANYTCMKELDIHKKLSHFAL